MPLTEQAAKKLAAAIHQLMLDDPRRDRPWDEPGIFKALGVVQGRDQFDTFMAATRAAADLSAETPGVICAANSLHWSERVSAVRSPRNPTPREECIRHIGQFRANCSACASERLAPVVELHPDAPPPDLSDVRAKLAAEREAYQAQVRNLRDQRNGKGSA